MRPKEGITPQPIFKILKYQWLWTGRRCLRVGRAPAHVQFPEFVAAKTFGRSAHHQCAWKSASTVAIPAIIEPVIAIAAGMALGNSRLTTVATKIAATGRTTTK